VGLPPPCPMGATDYCISGGEAAGETTGFGSGTFVAVGDGSGCSASTDRVGEGNGGFLGFEFWFELSFALTFAPPMSTGLGLTSGDAEVFALTV